MRERKGRGIAAVPLRTVLVAAVLTSMSVTGVAGSTGSIAAPVEPVSLRCGYDVDAALGQAFYTHCAETTRVAVYVEYRAGLIAEKCFGPGTHPLGSSDVVRFAYYAGRLC